MCRYYKYSISSLDLLFQSLSLSIFIYGIKVCGNAFYSKYFSRIDKFVARALKSGYCIKQYYITDILKRRDFKLWHRITTTETALRELLPPKRTRQLRKRVHNYILPKINTEPFKSVFINRCLFDIVV